MTWQLVRRLIKRASGTRSPSDLDQAHMGEFIVVDLISEIQWLGLNHAIGESWSYMWQLVDALMKIKLRK